MILCVADHGNPTKRHVDRRGKQGWCNEQKHRLQDERSECPVRSLLSVDGAANVPDPFDCVVSVFLGRPDGLAELTIASYHHWNEEPRARTKDLVCVHKSREKEEDNRNYGCRKRRWVSVVGKNCGLIVGGHIVAKVYAN